MRILQINKFYYLKGGAERYLFDLGEILSRHGHEVIPFAMASPKNFPSPYATYFVSEVSLERSQLFCKKLQIARRVLWSKEAAKKLELLIKETKPDIAHLHNIAHQLSPSIIHVLKKYRIPMVQTLHDYKLISLNYNLFRSRSRFAQIKTQINADEMICKICATPPYRWWKPFTHRCLGSWSEQWLLALEMLVHRLLKSYSFVDHFIAPSQFMKDMCVRHGIPSGKITVLPYLLLMTGIIPVRTDMEGASQHYILYLGRLSKEKGVDILLEAMKDLPEVKLKIAGSGPEEENYKLKAISDKLSNVEFMGYKTGEELKQTIAGSSAVIVPSLWYENSPLAIYEAFASGKPVIASRIGGIPESRRKVGIPTPDDSIRTSGLVRDGQNGILCKPGDPRDLAEKIRWFLSQPLEQKIAMGKAALDFAQRTFDPERHYQKLMEIYERVQKNKKTR